MPSIAKKLNVNLDTINQKIIRTDFTSIVGDSVEITINISEGELPKDIENCTIRLVGIRSDQSYFEQAENITIIDGLNGELKINPRLDVLSVVGQCVLGLIIEDEDESISIQRFTINVGNSIVKDIIIDNKNDIETILELNKLLNDYRTNLDTINNDVNELENAVNQKIAEASSKFNEISESIDNQIDVIENKINNVNNALVTSVTQKIKLNVHRISGSNYIYFKTDVINEPAKNLLKKQYLVSIGGCVGTGTYNSSISILSFYMENSTVYSFMVSLSDRMVGSRNINASVVYHTLRSDIGMNETGFSLYFKSNLMKDLNTDSEIYCYLTQLS